jgi:hypothetical protein
LPDGESEIFFARGLDERANQPWQIPLRGHSLSGSRAEAVRIFQHMLPPLSLVDRNRDAAIHLTADEDSSPEIRFKEAQRRIEWTCSRSRKCPGLPRPLTTKQI